jgi:hypothetical protein
MSQEIKLRRSNIAGKTPDRYNINIGEFGLNTADGIFYFKRGDETIQALVSTNAPIKGNIILEEGSLFINDDSFFSSSVNISGSINLTGPLNLLPTERPLAYSSSIYVTSSVDNKGRNDLYIADGVTNVRFTSITDTLKSGIIAGGVISITGSSNELFNVASGSGQIVNINKDGIYGDPHPTVTYVDWPPFNEQTSSFLTTDDTTWLLIDKTGSLIQQNTVFTDEQYETHIILGALIHPNNTSINLAKTFPVVSYGTSNQFEDFIRLFGPIKASGHILFPSGSSLSVNRSTGRSFVLGRNYVTNPEAPNIISDPEKEKCLFYRYYRSGSVGSGFETDDNTGAGYDVIDPGKYDNGTGILADVPEEQYTIQRIFYFPGQIDLLGVYYGRTLYNSLSSAEEAATLESFTEIENTFYQAIFVGYLVVKGGTTDLSNTSDAKFIQTGLFRGTGGGGGGTVGTPAKTVKLSPSSYTVIYDTQGINPDPQYIFITASAQGFSTPLFKFTGDGIPNGTTYTSSPSGSSAYVTFTASANYSSTPNRIRVGVAEGNQIESIFDTVDIVNFEPGVSPIYYYIKPLSGSVLKNGNGYLEFQAVKIEGSTETDLISGDIKIYSGSTELNASIEGVSNGTYSAGSAAYNPIISGSFITGSLVLSLKSGSVLYDTITIADISDGIDTGYIEFSPTNVLKRTNGTSFYTPASSSGKIYFYDFPQDEITPGSDKYEIFTGSFIVSASFDGSTDQMFYLTGSDFSPKISLTANDGDGVIYNGPGISNILTTKDLVLTARFLTNDNTTLQVQETFYIASEGADGQDAFTVLLGKESHVLPSTDTGIVTDYSNSGTNFLVFEGTNKLTASLGPTGSLSETEYTVVISSSLNITPSSSFFINNDNEIEIGNHSAMDPNESIAQITYLIYTNDLVNQPIKKIQTFTKTKNGVSPVYYYIKPLDGTVLKDKSKKLTLQAVKISGSAEPINLLSGDITIFSGSVELTSSIDGVEDGSNGAKYNPIISGSFINGSLVLSLKSGSTGPVYDTITLIDVTDGIPAGAIEATTLTLRRNPGETTYKPISSSGTVRYFEPAENELGYIEYTGSFDIVPVYESDLDKMYFLTGNDFSSLISLTASDADGNTTTIPGYDNRFSTTDFVLRANFTPQNSTIKAIPAIETFYIVSNGADGQDAFGVYLTNDSHTLTADKDGIVTNYDGSGTRVIVYEGINKLTASLGPSSSLSENEYTVIVSGSTNITASNEFSIANNEFVIGDHSNMRGDEDTASVTYLVYTKDLVNQPITKTQTFSKSKQGILGPGVVFRGTFSQETKYYHTNERRDIVFYLGNYYYVNNPSKNDLPGWDFPDALVDWVIFGAQFDAVATDILFAQDVFVNRVLNIGANIDGQPVIAINPDSGSYNNPYISLGQPIAGFRRSGIYLGYSDTTASLSLSSSNSLFSWKGGNLVVSGSDVQIQTPRFYLGGTSQFISGSGGLIEISSSNFHLKNGNITASNGIFSGSIQAQTGSFTGKVTVGSSENMIIDPNSNLFSVTLTAFSTRSFNIPSGWNTNITSSVVSSSDYTLVSSSLPIVLSIRISNINKTFGSVSVEGAFNGAGPWETIRVYDINKNETTSTDYFTPINLGGLTHVRLLASAEIGTINLYKSGSISDVPEFIQYNPKTIVNKDGIFVKSTPSTILQLTGIVGGGGGGSSITSNILNITAGDGLSGGGNVDTVTLSLDTGSNHFISGARKTISTSNTTGTSGINFGYNSGTGVLSASLATSSLTIGNTSVSLGGTATTIAGLTSITSTNITGSNIVISGNTKLGDDASDSHTITGSLGVNGSVKIKSSDLISLDIQGNSGQLFSVEDSLTGTLMSVNDISGLPILEVSSDDKVVMGTFGAYGLTVTGSNIKIGNISSNSHTITGSLGILGSASINGLLNVGNLRLDGNTLSSQNINGNIILDTNGTGVIDIKDNLIISESKLSVGTFNTSSKFTFDRGDFSSPAFFSGFAGSGFKLESGSQEIVGGSQSGSGWKLEIDHLSVRGTMKIYELLINQIRATNGSLWVSSVGKVENVIRQGSTSTYYIFFDTGSNSGSAVNIGHGFFPNDLIRAQRFIWGGQANGTGSRAEVYRSDLTVTNVKGNIITASLRSGTAPPSGGFEYVRIGNTTNNQRQGAVYLTADDNDAPFIDVIDKVNSFDAFEGNEKSKVRIGKLNGITSTVFGKLTGSGGTDVYGFWASGSAYLEGSINATAGKIANWVIVENSITSSNIHLSSSNGGVIRMGSTLPTSHIVGNGIFLSGSGQALIGSASGHRIQFDGSNLILSSSTFLLGNSTNFVSGSGGNIRISGSNVQIQTPSFYFGGISQFISGSGGLIEISSSNFHLKNGNITASNGIFSGSIQAQAGSFTGNISVGTSSFVVIGPNANVSSPLFTNLLTLDAGAGVNLPIFNGIYSQETSSIIASSNYTSNQSNIEDWQIRATGSINLKNDLSSSGFLFIDLKGYIEIYLEVSSSTSIITGSSISVPYSFTRNNVAEEYVVTGGGDYKLYYTVPNNSQRRFRIRYKVFVTTTGRGGTIIEDEEDFSNVVIGTISRSISRSVPNMVIKNTGVFVDYGEGKQSLLDLTLKTGNSVIIGGGGGGISSIIAGDGLNGGTIISTGTISLNTGSNHFISGARKTISTSNTTGASGINFGYNNGTGVLSASLANSSLTIGNTNISLGGTATTIAGLTSITSTNITGSNIVASGNVKLGDATSDSHTITGSLGINGRITLRGSVNDLPNTGTGFLFSSAYNTTGNKQFWMGDVDFLGSSTNNFLRIVSFQNQTYIDSVSGDGNTIKNVIFAPNGGDVGINTFSPVTKFDVNGTGLIRTRLTVGNSTQFDTSGSLIVYGNGKNSLTIHTNDNTLDRGIAFRNSGGAYIGYINIENAGSSLGNMVFGVSSATQTNVNNVNKRLTIKNDGNIEVEGNIVVADSIIHLGDTNTLIQFPSNDNISLQTNGSEKIRISSTATIVTGSLTLNRGDFQSPDYTSDGYAGRGFKLISGSTDGTIGGNTQLSSGYKLELDHLLVRGTMRIYELLINQIRATNGTLFVSSVGKVNTVSGPSGGLYNLTFDTGSDGFLGHGFLVNDIIRAQRFSGASGGGSVYQSDLQVVTVSNDGKTVTVNVIAGNIPLPGYEYVRLGNSVNTSRQGTVYLTADDTNAPYINVIDGVTSHATWNTPTVLKARMGKLNGITSSLFGGPSTGLTGYGFYASGSAYLEGGINATSGRIANWTIVNNAITSSNIHLSSSNGGVIRMGSTLPTSHTNGNGVFLSGSGQALIGNAAGSRIQFDGSNLILSSSTFYLGGNSQFISGSGGVIEISSSNFHLKNGNITASNGIFSGSIQAQAGSFTGNISVGTSSFVVIGPNAAAGNPTLLSTSMSFATVSLPTVSFSGSSDAVFSSTLSSVGSISISNTKDLIIKASGSISIPVSQSNANDILTIDGYVTVHLYAGNISRSSTNIPFSLSRGAGIGDFTVNYSNGQQNYSLYYTSNTNSSTSFSIRAQVFITNNTSTSGGIGAIRSITGTIGRQLNASSPNLVIRNTGIYVNYDATLGETNLLDLALKPGSSVIIGGGGGGGVSSITAGDGLNGGTITSTGIISINTGSTHFTNGVKAKLNTDGVISGSSQININSTTGTLNVDKGGTGQTTHGNRQILFGSGSNPIQSNSNLVWATTDRLGIMTSNPQAALHVVGTGNILRLTTSGTNDQSGVTLRFENTDTSIANGQGYGGIEWAGLDADINASGVRARIRGISEGTAGATAIAFFTANNNETNPSERLRIKANGEVETPLESSFRIGTSTGARLRIHHNIGNAYIDWNSGSLFIRNNITERVTIAPNGNVTATNFILTSDRRLKSDITELNNGLELISKLQPKEYIKNENKEIGFVTDEIPKDLDFLVKRNSEYEALDYVSIIGILVKSIQELKEEIDYLKNKIK